MKCPKCGGIIEFDDCCDSYTDEEVHVNYCYGHCLNCETNYKWKEIYEYTRQEDLEEFI